MKSVRELETFKNSMIKIHGEIKRLADAAKIICDEKAATMCDCEQCPFAGDNNEYCILEILADELKVN
jgi:hypothetical protein